MWDTVIDTIMILGALSIPWIALVWVLIHDGREEKDTQRIS